MKKNFVPKNFNIPLKFRTDKYKLEVLTPKVGEIDYDAVMSSKERLRSVFARCTEWPKDKMTLKENINDLRRHEQEFLDRKAFAYTVLNLTGDYCIGCVYIEPSSKINFDCEVYLWVRNSEIKFDPDLYQNIKSWIKTEWPFKNAAFPGRDIAWAEWNQFK